MLPARRPAHPAALAQMIHVERGGDGAACYLLLHGMGVTAAVWTDVTRRLEQHGLGRWIAPDLPGHGASAPDEHYSIGHFAAELAPLASGTEPVYLVGHSLGAYIALALASSWFGVRPAGVLGIGPKISWSEADLQRVDELAARPPRIFGQEAEAIERYRKVSGLDGAAPRLLARGVRPTEGGFQLAADPRAMLVAGAPFATLAHSAGCRVLLARGEHDPMVSLSELRQHADGVELAGRGHNAHAEDPDAVVELCARLAGSQ